MNRLGRISMEELQLAAHRAVACVEVDGRALREAGVLGLAEKAGAVSAALEAVLKATGDDSGGDSGNKSQRGTI